MKELLFIVAFIIILLAILGARDMNFRDACYSHKVTPVINQYTRVCYEPGVAIDVN